jgi:hypothetical protein
MIEDISSDVLAIIFDYSITNMAAHGALRGTNRAFYCIIEKLMRGHGGQSIIKRMFNGQIEANKGLRGRLGAQYVYICRKYGYICNIPAHDIGPWLLNVKPRHIRATAIVRNQLIIDNWGTNKRILYDCKDQIANLGLNEYISFIINAYQNLIYWKDIVALLYLVNSIKSKQGCYLGLFIGLKCYYEGHYWATRAIFDTYRGNLTPARLIGHIMDQWIIKGGAKKYDQSSGLLFSLIDQRAAKEFSYWIINRRIPANVVRSIIHSFGLSSILIHLGRDPRWANDEDLGPRIQALRPFEF